MSSSFDEMRTASGAVREHYRSYERWLQQQPHELMQGQRE